MITKNILMVSISIALFCALLIIKDKSSSSENAEFTISIIQSASHPELDAARLGFIEALQRKLDKTAHFVIHDAENAERSSSRTHAIAQRLLNQKGIKLFYATATVAIT